MSPERLQQLEALFFEALDLPPEAQAAFLERINRQDPQLCRDLEHLLQADAHPAPLFEDDLGPPFAQESSIPDLTNRRIGPYRILRLIGQGGMGAVYLAQREDVDHQVALKLVRAGLAAPDHVQRFLLERKILARLQHPNIARFLDAGVTEDGLPYFVMEYIRGTSILDFCDRHRLDIEARLELFRVVCRAVHYAHQNLIVHRDMKPSNILVQDDGTVKLLDFGIAKLLEEPGESAPTLTRSGMRVLTPAYASPEQIRGEPVSTASDIYTLGVLLYELLTGHRPFNVRDRSPGEVERLICEAAPDRPSNIISKTTTATDANGNTTTVTPESVCLARNLSMGTLKRQLRGDLDNIVLMALRKEPTRRYSSVEMFESDIGRFLAHRPVAARRGAWTYRTAKFVRRHRRVLVGVAGTMLLVVIFSLVYYRRVSEINTVRQAAVSAQETSDVLADYHQIISRFASSPDSIWITQIHARLEQWLLYRDGYPGQQIRLLTATAHTLSEREKYEEVEAVLRRAYTIAETHYAEPHADLFELKETWATLQWNTGFLNRADSTYQDLLATMAHVGGKARQPYVFALRVYSKLKVVRGQYDQAVQLAREAVELGRTVWGRNHPQYNVGLMNLGANLIRNEQYSEAVPLFEEALQIEQQRSTDEHVNTAVYKRYIGLALDGMEEYEKAEVYLLEALDLYRRLMGNQHREVVRTLLYLGYHHEDQDHFEEAETYFRKAATLAGEVFGEQHSSHLQHLNIYGRFMLLNADPEHTEPILRDILRRARVHLGTSHRFVAEAQRNLGVFLIDRAHFEEAKDLLQSAYRFRSTRYDTDHPDMQQIIKDLEHLYTTWNRPRQAAAFTAQLEKNGIDMDAN